MYFTSFISITQIIRFVIVPQPLLIILNVNRKKRVEYACKQYIPRRMQTGRVRFILIFLSGLYSIVSFFITLIPSLIQFFRRLLSILIIYIDFFPNAVKKSFCRFFPLVVAISLINHSDEITLNESAIHKLLRQRNGMPWHEMKIDRVSRIRAYGE